VVCGRVLAQLLIPGTRETFAYTHTPGQVADHPPVVARAGEVPQQVRYRCDFCWADGISHTLVVTKEVSLPSAGATYDLEWAMCPACSELVLDDDWLNLRRRVFAAFERLHGGLHEEVRVELRLMYRELRDSMLFIYQEP
jgi:hypothetical protein